MGEWEPLCSTLTYPEQAELAGRLPRITRLMAVAVYFDDLIRRGDVKSYAELVTIGHVSRSRVSQIMDLLNLAPPIQEITLSLPPITAGREPFSERAVRGIVTEAIREAQLIAPMRFRATNSSGHS
jgi:hypothetical protein